MRLTRKGRGMVAVDDYAALIDPTGEAMPTRLATPNPLPQGERGRLRSANRPYSIQFDPIRPYPLPQASYPHGGIAPGSDGNARRGCNPRTLAQGRETGWTPLKLLPPLTVATRLRR